MRCGHRCDRRWLPISECALDKWRGQSGGEQQATLPVFICLPLFSRQIHTIFSFCFFLFVSFVASTFCTLQSFALSFFFCHVVSRSSCNALRQIHPQRFDCRLHLPTVSRLDAIYAIFFSRSSPFISRWCWISYALCSRAAMQQRAPSFDWPQWVGRWLSSK